MSDTPKTVFVTKWALEDGILRINIERISSAGMLYGRWSDRLLRVPKDDWHLTREAALTRAHQMRDAKITSLERQVERLRGMRF